MKALSLSLFVGERTGAFETGCGGFVEGTLCGRTKLRSPFAPFTCQTNPSLLTDLPVQISSANAHVELAGVRQAQSKLAGVVAKLAKNW